MRLDKYLVENGYIDSRNKGLEAIKDGKVSVNSITIFKPSFIVEDGAEVVLKESLYVSRAGLKLKNFLAEINLNLENLVGLDIGSSTGGFIEVLLENGIKNVVGVDVGTGQLHNKLREDGRVLIYEECDVREFFRDEKFDIVTVDVSFISIKNIISDIDRLAKDNIIILFKPQFEVGIRAKRDKNGVVVDEREIERAKDSFLLETKKLNWKLIYTSESKIKGKEGNIEQFYQFKK